MNATERLRQMEDAAAAKKLAADAYWRGESGTPLKPLAGAMGALAGRIDPASEAERIADVAYVTACVDDYHAGQIDAATLVGETTGRQRFRYCAAKGFASDEANTIRAIVAEGSY